MKRQKRKVGVAGGFINQMMGNNKTEPKVGEGATILHYSDRSAYEVISVSEDKNACQIRKLKTTWCGEAYGDERYTYESDPNGHTYTLEWNSRRNKWCKTWNETKLIKAIRKRLYKKHGYGWTDYLKDETGYSYKEMTKTNEDSVTGTVYKSIPGVTKNYKEQEPVSIIFGVKQEYRDPHF